MKKNTPIIPFLSAVFLLIIWTACHKSNSSSNNNTNDPSARTVLLTKASWKFDTSGADFNKDGIIDAGDNTLEPCFKDNTYQFNTDSTGTADNGALKCNVSDPQTFPFTWSFSNKGDSVISSNADPILANGINIFSMTDTKIVLYKDTSAFGQNFWYVISLKH
jgi:hypothetical protein